MRTLVCFLIICLSLFGWSLIQTTQRTAAVSRNVNSAVTDYTEHWVDAVNNDDFSLVAGYWTQGSENYRRHRQVLQAFHKKGTLSLIGAAVLSCEATNETGVYKVKAAEKYAIKRPDGAVVDLDGTATFLVDAKQDWKLTAFREPDSLFDLSGRAALKPVAALLGHWSGNGSYLDFYDNSRTHRKAVKLMQAQPRQLYFTNTAVVVADGQHVISHLYQLNSATSDTVSMNLDNGEQWVLNFSGENNRLAINQAPIQNGHLNPIRHAYRYSYSYKDSRQTL